MTPRRMLILGMGLLVAAVASAVAPTHPLYNPPACKFLLGAMALTVAMFAREAARWPSPAAQDPDDVEFVVTFDDRVISLANPDGSTESARWDDLESISIQPDDDPYLIWTGPYFVVLHVRGRRLLIPALTVGLEALLKRLLELPGIDRHKVEALLTEGRPSPCVLWKREKETDDSIPSRDESSRRRSSIGRFI